MDVIINMEWEKITDHVESVFSSRLQPIESRLQSQTNEIKQLMELALNLASHVKTMEQGDYLEHPVPTIGKIQNKGHHTDRSYTGPEDSKRKIEPKRNTLEDKKKKPKEDDESKKEEALAKRKEEDAKKKKKMIKEKKS